jgi:hypothetical protein
MGYQPMVNTMMLPPVRALLAQASGKPSTGALQTVKRGMTWCRAA